MTTVNKPKHNLEANLLDNLVGVNRTVKPGSLLYEKYFSYAGSCLSLMLRVFLVYMSSRLSLDSFMLNLVARPLFDEEIWVRDFVILGLGFYRFNPVMSSLFSIDFSFMYQVQFSSVPITATLLL